MWHEIYSLVCGATSETKEVNGNRDPYETAQEMIDELRGEKVDDWEVYVLPHYCDRNSEDGECVCAQYLNDHSPFRSSTDYADENSRVNRMREFNLRVIENDLQAWSNDLQTL